MRIVWAGSFLALGSGAALEKGLGKSVPERCVLVLRVGGSLR